MESFLCNSTVNQNNTWENMDYVVLYFLPIALIVPPLGIPVNALAIRLLLGKPGISSTSEIFILNLALFDLLFCFLLLVEYVRLVCVRTMEAANFMAWGLNQVGGPMLLCILGLDSYMAVCHPLVFLRLKDPKLRLSLCFAVSVVAATTCGLVKVSTKYKWSLICGVLSAAMATIMTCNILILKSLRQSGPGRKEVHPMKKRAFKIVLTALLLVNVHYIPPLVEYLTRQFGPRQFRPFSVLTCVTYLALSMASFVQPLCYLVRTKQLPKMRCDAGGSAVEAKTV